MLARSWLVEPVQRACDGFRPGAVKSAAPRLRHLRFPALVDRPIADQIFAIAPKPYRKTCGVCGSQGGGLGDLWPHHGNIENVRLELHQQFVADHSTVDAQLRNAYR